MNETEGKFYLENNQCIDDPSRMETAEIPLGTQFVTDCIKLLSDNSLWCEGCLGQREERYDPWVSQPVQ